MVLLAATLLVGMPQRATLQTRWAKTVTPANVHREYPRPQMVRPNWTNLNGLWEFAITPGNRRPSAFSEHILVPFPVEASLSGVGRNVPNGSTVWYRRTFVRPKGERALLHFGAVDWSTTVWVNGKEVGRHQGGYDPFTFDVTNALKSGSEQELVVAVTDPTDAGPQPRGKQVRRPGGIFYTPTTGIWQTVWLEGVPTLHLESLYTVPNLRTGEVNVYPAFSREPMKGFRMSAEVMDGSRVVASGKLQPLTVPNPKSWSPDHPFLYGLRVTLSDEKGRTIDQVKSYFAFREVSLGKDEQGRTRILLNGKPTFMVGPLDQGFWPDGIYTAPSDAAMRYDLEVTKQLGFNMIRKHVKVEPDTWYAACDKMGILVWQDMPSGDASIGPNDPDIKRSPASAKIFEHELEAMVDNLRNHPSIVAWVVFNEGWGQYDTARLAAYAKRLDSTRLIDATTGWADRGVGDMIDWHVYPGPGSPKPEAKRAAVLGEFGGLGMPTPGHMWEERSWGYQTFKSREELTTAFEGLFANLRFLIAEPGLSAAVYTQTTDVETEANGLMTYDRAVMKMDPRRVRRAVKALFGPAAKLETILATSEDEPQTWQYTLTAPPAGWESPSFSDVAWSTGRGGFGTEGTPGAVVGTTWSGSDIWLRRPFTLAQPANQLYLRLHHDDEAEVYIDGKRVASLQGWTSAYTLLSLGKLSLTAGTHTLAVHCHQDRGGQFIDVGLVRAP